MADNYIDQDETQIYGPRAAKLLRARVVGLLEACDAAITYFADELDHATEAVAEQIQAARAASADQRKGARNKQPPLAAGTKLLGRFSTHLDTHAGDIDRRTFFLKDGTATGVGKGGARVLLALTNIKQLLGAKGCKVDNKAKWLAEFTEAVAALTPALETAEVATTDRRSMTPDVEAAREAWLSTYRSAREVTTGVLRQAGRLDLLKVVFYDLAVPAGAKVDSIPEPPPPAPAPPEPDPTEPPT